MNESLATYILSHPLIDAIAIVSIREALRKKTANFITSFKKVGRWHTQNMISFLKEIMTRPELDRIVNMDQIPNYSVFENFMNTKF